MITTKALRLTLIIGIMITSATACFAQESEVLSDGTYTRTIIYHPKLIKLDTCTKVNEDILFDLLRHAYCFFINQDKIGIYRRYYKKGTTDFSKSDVFVGSWDSAKKNVDSGWFFSFFNRDFNSRNSYQEKIERQVITICKDTVYVQKNKIAIPIIFANNKSDFSVTKIQVPNEPNADSHYWIGYRDIFPIEFSDDGLENAKKLSDFFFTLQYPYNVEILEKQLNNFKPIASQYRTQTPKPTVTEEQRKYIVQANLFVQQKEYNKAIDMYRKVIDIHATSYPAAYYNRALLFAEMRKFDIAIYEVKKYLLLVPDASNARAAQDKIYEWEAAMGK